MGSFIKELLIPTMCQELFKEMGGGGCTEENKTEVSLSDEFEVRGSGPTGKVILDRNFMLRLEKEMSGKVHWKGGREIPGERETIYVKT